MKSDKKKIDLQLNELFNKLIDEPMKKLGFCCGQDFSYEPQMLSCKTDGCVIKVGATYYSFSDPHINPNIDFCKKCFNSFASGYIDIGDEK